MSTPILFSSAPASGFDEPFAMLEACHDRVRRMIDLLARLREYLPQHGADAQARGAAQDVMRYFDVAAPAHHEDEERHVFPLLRERGIALDAVAQMEHEHVRIQSMWTGVRAWLAGVAAGTVPPPDPAAESLLDAFAGIHASHLLIEDSLTHPAAQALSDASAQRRMGREMAARRGVAWQDAEAA